MSIQDIAFIAYPVTDIPRARAFYGDILGLTTGEIDHELKGMPGKYWIEYEIGNGTLAISNSWEPSGQGGPAVGLEVEDFEATMSRLKVAGVKIHADRIETPVCCFALISDPDRNSIMIHKRHCKTHDTEADN